MHRTFASTWKRLAIAIGLILIGMAFIPYVALPSERFGWQIFAGIYGGDPELAINYPDGAPGSSFTITGINFPANTPVTLKVKGTTIGTHQTDEIGAFMLRITTTADTDEGLYALTIAEDQSQAIAATAASAKITFSIDDRSPLRAPDGTSTTIALPDGLAQSWLYMPVINR